MAFVSPRMSLKVWNAASDPYDHEQLADNFLKLDMHDHSPGRGTPIGGDGIRDGAIAANHFAPGALSASLFPVGSIGTTLIADNAITNIKMADNSVNTAEIVDGSVTNPKLATDSVSTIKVQSDAITADKIAPAVLNQGGLNETSVIRRGSTSINTTETVAGASGASGGDYTTWTWQYMATPDRVDNIVVPANALIFVGFKAEWAYTGTIGSTQHARASIAIGNNVLMSDISTLPYGQQAEIFAPSIGGPTPPSTYNLLTTGQIGLTAGSQSTSWSGDPANAMVLGQLRSNTVVFNGGMTTIFNVPAGTYNIGIRYSSSTGISISTRNRRLWVKVESF
jgi:hypothetical protein